MGTLVRRIASLKCKEVKHRMKREEIIIGGASSGQMLSTCRYADSTVRSCFLRFDTAEISIARLAQERMAFPQRAHQSSACFGRHM